VRKGGCLPTLIDGVAGHAGDDVTLAPRETGQRAGALAAGSATGHARKIERRGGGDERETAGRQASALEHLMPAPALPCFPGGRASEARHPAFLTVP
jgi:hypothetical protein